MNENRRRLLIGGALFTVPAAVVVQAHLLAPSFPLFEPQEEIEVEMGDGDLLVLHINQPIDNITAERIQQIMEDKLMQAKERKGPVVLILDNNINYSVIRREE